MEMNNLSQRFVNGSSKDKEEIKPEFPSAVRTKENARMIKHQPFKVQLL